MHHTAKNQMLRAKTGCCAELGPVATVIIGRHRCQCPAQQDSGLVEGQFGLRHRGSNHFTKRGGNDTLCAGEGSQSNLDRALLDATIN